MSGTEMLNLIDALEDEGMDEKKIIEILRRVEGRLSKAEREEKRKSEEN